MLKKLIDTNIFIDRFSNPNLYREIFLSEGLVYLSSVVLMELKAGAYTKEAINAVNELYKFFRRVERIVTPSIREYEQAGEIIMRLQNMKGYEIKKCASITSDCLIASSVRNMGGVLYTQNKKDFQAIQDVFDFNIYFV